jgi:hypothetical protein
MKFHDDRTLPLPLLGGVVQRQHLVVPPEVVMSLKSWRHACRLAWKLRHPRITQRVLAELVPGLYQSHVSDYFAVRADRREMPAKHVGSVEAVIGNSVMTQWLCQQGKLTPLEEMQVARRRA